jgi:3-dehydroquinate synthase
LNFGHTIGHAIEAETEYKRFLHGEAVALGMIAATHLAVLTHNLPVADAGAIIQTIADYGSLPPSKDLDPDRLLARLASDKKTLQGTVHFVLPVRIGEVTVSPGIEPTLIRQAMLAGLADHH